MAFWRNFAPSNVEKILEKEEFELEELLDEEDFVQECKHCCNETLLNFLGMDENIAKMVKYLVGPIPEDSDAEQTATHKRRIGTCAEVFLCEVAVMLQAFTNSAEHVGVFLEYLSQPVETDPIRDGFFCRVFVTVARSYPEKISDYLDTESFVPAVVARLSNDSFKNDLLLPIMKANSEEGLHKISLWMIEAGIVQKLLVAYSNTEDASTHRNIAEVLNELVQDSKLCLEILQQRENLEMLMTGLQSNMLKTADTMHVLMGLVVSVQQSDDDDDEFPDPDAQKTEEPKETPPFVAVICEHMPALAAALSPVAADAEKVVHIPVGPVKPPLGRVRLEALHFFALLLRGFKDDAGVQQQLVANNVLKLCVDILFSHTWHNIAHFYVQEVVTHCLESESLRNALIEEADLPKRMVEAMEALPPPPEEGTAPDITYHRPGHIGTIVDLALAMELQLHEQLSEDEQWTKMVEGTLAEEKRKQSLELGQSMPSAALGRFAVNDSSSSDEERDPDNNSSGSSDEDDDPLRHFSAGAASNNNMSDTFRSNTSFVNDGADAWESHEITDSTADSEWVANFEANFDADPWAGEAASQADTDAWKADFEAGSASAFGVEDPFAAEPAENPPFEADFGSATSPAPDEAVEVSFAEAFAEATEPAAVAAPSPGDAHEVIDDLIVDEEPATPPAAEAVEEVPEEVPEVASEDTPAEVPETLQQQPLGL